MNHQTYIISYHVKELKPWQRLKLRETSSENPTLCFSNQWTIVLQVAWSTKREYTIVEFNYYELRDKKKLLTSSSTQGLQSRSFNDVECTRTAVKYTKVKSARAKRVKLLFVIVKYVNKFLTFLSPCSQCSRKFHFFGPITTRNFVAAKTSSTFSKLRTS